MEKHMRINFGVDYYNDKHPERQRELEHCLAKNIENSHIDHIYMFLQPNCVAPEFSKVDKVTILQQTEQITYAGFFRHTQQFPDDINIVANADIYFDETVIHALTIKKEEAWAISRYNLDSNNVPFLQGSVVGEYPTQAAHVSQDVWVFKGAVDPVEGSEMHMGTGGCDNRIAYLLVMAGYQVTNPCGKLRAYHYHMTNIRYWTTGGMHPYPHFFPRPDVEWDTNNIVSFQSP
jgi:hypothetical protein